MKKSSQTFDGWTNRPTKIVHEQLWNSRAVYSALRDEYLRLRLLDSPNDVIRWGIKNKLREQYKALKLDSPTDLRYICWSELAEFWHKELEEEDR